MTEEAVCAPIQVFRKFNRFYTRQIGVLNKGHLQSAFSLAEVRVLYELAHHDRSNATALCNDLGLDPGYLSRMLRGFEKKSLIRKLPSTQDGRQVLLELTSQGRKQFNLLDRRATEEVSRLIDPLSPPEQKQLVSALQTIENLLQPEQSRQAASYTLRSHRPGDMGWVVNRHGALYWNEYHYDERFEALVAEIVAQFIQNFNATRERCWIAEVDGGPVGTVFLVKKSKEVAKLRLLLVEPSERGMGLGKRLVQECVAFARAAGYKKITLWTQSELTAARKIYEWAGFKLGRKHKHDSWSRRGLVSEVWNLEL